MVKDCLEQSGQSTEMSVTCVCPPATGADAAGVAVTSLFDPYRAVVCGLGGL